MNVLKFARAITWEHIGEVLKIQGTLIDEGIWTGLDGIPTQFSLDVIHRDSPSFIGKHIKRSHDDGEEYVIGFITAIAKTVTGAMFEGVIFDKMTIDEIELSGTNGSDGWSIEADVISKKEGDHVLAQSIKGTAVAHVGNPACETSRTETIKPIQLERGKEKMSTETEINDAEAPSRAEFFTWVEEQLKKAGVSAEDISKVLGVLKGAVKSPYPYPKAYPKPQSEAVSERLAEELAVKNKELGDLRKDLETKGTSLAEKDTKIKALEEKLSKLEEVINKAKLAEIEGIVNEIKAVDKEFDSAKFLEGIVELDSQKALLARYLDSVKRVAKVKMETKLTATDPEGLTSKAGEFFESLGISAKELIEGN